MVTTRSPPTSVLKTTIPAMIVHDFADDRRIAFPSGCARMAASTSIGIFGRHDRDQFSFVGDVERIEPEHVAGGLHFGFDGIAASSSFTPTRDASASSLSALETPPRVGIAHAADVRAGLEHDPDEIGERGACRFRGPFRIRCLRART